MSLAAGTSLVPYKILSALGSGGMGEVYCARDTKLERDVAIEVLPGHVAHDPQRANASSARLSRAPRGSTVSSGRCSHWINILSALRWRRRASTRTTRFGCSAMVEGLTCTASFSRSTTAPVSCEWCMCGVAPGDRRPPMN